MRAAIIICALGLLVTGARPGRVAIKAALFVPQIMPDAAARPLEWLTAMPIRERIAYPTPTGMGVADLYRPSRTRTHSAVLLFLGVAPAGPDDPRVVGLAEALARSGLVVMIPWSERMMAWRIDPDAPESLVAAFQRLRELPYVDGERVGMAGFCVGASLMLVAAGDSRINEQVAYVNSFGGYYDMRDLLSAIASKTRWYSEYQRPWTPGPLASEVFTNQMLEAPSDPDERRLLRRVYVDGEPASAAEIAALAETARIAYALLGDATLAEARALMDQLPPDLDAELDAISPSEVVNNIRAKVFVMHDREDDAVPSEESQRLVDALGDGKRVVYTEFSLFRHVEPTRQLGPWDTVREIGKLLLHMYRLLLVAA